MLVEVKPGDGAWELYVSWSSPSTIDNTLAWEDNVNKQRQPVAHTANEFIPELLFIKRQLAKEIDLSKLYHLYSKQTI